MLHLGHKSSPDLSLSVSLSFLSATQREGGVAVCVCVRRVGDGVGVRGCERRGKRSVIEDLQQTNSLDKKHKRKEIITLVSSLDPKL